LRLSGDPAPPIAEGHAIGNVVADAGLPALVLERHLEVFFPERGESAGPARRVCAACPVRQPCLDYAISNRIVHGIWGGLTERERRALRSSWVRASRRERDRAIVAAETDGFTAAAIGRTFGLSRTSVTRVLSRDADRRS
jgi:hypothetical protein